MKSTNSVTILDYGMGNLRSVVNAFKAVGANVRVTLNPADLASAHRIVLPGVGAFGDAMRNLSERGWIESLEQEVIEKQKPFLGICLGLQLLATTGFEHGACDGLKWIPGVVRKISVEDKTLRIPHMGWNDVQFKIKNGLYSGLGEFQTFYFVHSYVFEPEDSNVVSGVCGYGAELVASVQKGNITATQFHPEKSQKAGLAVLKNFLSFTA